MICYAIHGIINLPQQKYAVLSPAVGRYPAWFTGFSGKYPAWGVRKDWFREQTRLASQLLRFCCAPESICINIIKYLCMKGISHEYSRKENRTESSAERAC